MLSSIQKTFARIGAEVDLVYRNVPVNRTVRGPQVIAPTRLNIITKGGDEKFEIAVRAHQSELIELSFLEVLPKERHLVLLAREFDTRGSVVGKEHFLCGHDERHLFVAAVESVSTVAAAKASLKPQDVLLREVGINTEKRNRRKNKVFRRQGEWFFVPVEISVNANLIRRNEPLVRGRGSKPHWAQFAYRVGGTTVKVCSEYPNGLNEVDFKLLLLRDPKAKHLIWRDMQRDATVYVRGHIRHPDHATVHLDSWHLVLMNRERRTEAVAFLD